MNYLAFLSLDATPLLRFFLVLNQGSGIGLTIAYCVLKRMDRQPDTRKRVEDQAFEAASLCLVVVFVSSSFSLFFSVSPVLIPVLCDPRRCTSHSLLSSLLLI